MSQSNYTIQRLVIIMAMEDEARLIINSLQMKPFHSDFVDEIPMQFYQCQTKSLEITLVVSGKDERYQVDNIGTEAACLATYVAIKNFKPDLIISAGTAGGFGKKGAEIGTVYLSKKHFVYHDRHVPLPDFCESAIGYYPALDISKMAKDLNLPMGVISTGSSLKKNADDIVMIEKNNAVAKEMEVAAIAWVAMLLKTPLVAVKSITNILDEENLSEEAFIANLTFACQSLHDKVLVIIDYLQEKSLADLAL